jgi:hypothetical protein
MKRIHCQFCYALYEPVPDRKPSETCDKCWLEIAAQLSNAEREKTNAPTLH